MPRLSRSHVLLVALGVGWAVSGCTKHTIPNTDVEDNELNRRIVAFCEDYRRAVERRNVGLLLELADPAYFEDGGNVDTRDDIDYSGLREHLETKFSQTRAIRYEIRYRRVGKGRKNRYFVDYTYSASYKIPTEQGDVWRRVVADNRLVLARYGEAFRVVSGM